LYRGHILLGAYPQWSTFYREHILQGTHSIENTFYRGHIPLGAHYIGSTFHREHTWDLVRRLNGVERGGDDGNDDEDSAVKGHRVML